MCMAAGGIKGLYTWRRAPASRYIEESMIMWFDWSELIGGARVRPVARGCISAIKLKGAYEHTACCNLAPIWTTKRTYKFMSLPCPQAEQ